MKDALGNNEKGGESMAVNKVAQGSRMVITVQSGLNTSGQPVYTDRTYKTVKASATDSDVYAIAAAMGGLQKYPVTGFSRLDEGNLVNA